MLPRDFDQLTPADWTEYQRGRRDRQDDVWELAAWTVLTTARLANTKRSGPVSMATLIPHVWMRRERRRAAAEAAMERANAERRKAGLPPLSGDEED